MRPSGAGRPRRVSKAERWLNLLAFLLDRRSPVPREEILSQVDDYKRDWRDKAKRESVRRKFERDKQELKALGIAIEPQPAKVEAGHTSMPVRPKGRPIIPQPPDIWPAPIMPSR